MLRPGLLAACLGLALAESTLAAPSWDGTWVGGWEEGDGIQIIVAGEKVTDVGRGDAYPEVLSTDVSRDGSMLVFWWVGGDALLQRVSDRKATISMRERERPVRSFAVKRE
jgi:hypothetical protein